jgi:hypothetical protein
MQQSRGKHAANTQQICSKVAVNLRQSRNNLVAIKQLSHVKGAAIATRQMFAASLPRICRDFAAL